MLRHPTKEQSFMWPTTAIVSACPVGSYQFGQRAGLPSDSRIARKLGNLEAGP